MDKIKPKAMLFDMDGVIVDSFDAWWDALNYSIKHFNQQEISKKKFFEIYWGHDLYDNLEKMNLSLEVGKFCNSIYYKYTDKVKLYPMVKDTLEKLYSYKKSVITNTPRDCTIQILKNNDIEKYFNFVITSSEVSKGKPSPEIVYNACKKMKVKPEDAVLIGDTDSDMKAGRAAGCITIGIKIDGDYKIDTLSDIKDIIKI